MYAIVEIAGQQFKVQKDQKVFAGSIVVTVMSLVAPVPYVVTNF